MMIVKGGSSGFGGERGFGSAHLLADCLPTTCQMLCEVQAVRGE